PACAHDRSARASGKSAASVAHHWHLYVLAPGGIQCEVVPGVGMPNDAQTRVGGQDALDALVHVVTPVGDQHLTRVDGVPDPDPSPVVYRDSARAGYGVGQGVENRPICYGVAAISHALGLATRRGDGSA